MKKIKEILDTEEEFTMGEFWKVIDDLPSESKEKKLVKDRFKKNGDPKSKAMSLNAQQDYQNAYDTEVFISNYVAREIHINKLRRRKENHKLLIKEKKTRTHKVGKDGEIGKRENGEIYE